jgi:hypothetical protein
MLQRALVHLRPISREFLLRGRSGIRQQLEDVLARHADMRLFARAGRDDRRRFHARSRKIVAQSLKHRCAQQAIIGDRAIFNFGVDLRIDPGRFRLVDRN